MTVDWMNGDEEIVKNQIMYCVLQSYYMINL